MPTPPRKIDRLFLATVLVLTAAGFVIFLSASLGLLNQNGASFGSVAFKQALSLGLGLLLFFVFSRIHYVRLRKLAWIILAGSIIINLLLFVPSLTLHYNGASRWLSFGPLTFQPSELLKIAFIIYLAAWAQAAGDKIGSLRRGLLPYLVLTAILSVLLLAQRDTDTFIVIAGTGLLIMFVAGLPLRQVFLSVALLAIIVGGVLVFRPYALDRVKTFLNHGADQSGSGYQINQSLIAIGSGRLHGRGFGQSIQKFGYLPQPTDDSIFAVAAEEFGFVGSLTLLLLYFLLAASMFRIGNRAPDIFGGLLAIGTAILITGESFMNIGAMLGLVPLSGMPLLFVSHGGTALIISLVTAGIVANVSKYAR